MSEEIYLHFEHLKPLQWKELVKELWAWVKENGSELSTQSEHDKILSASHRTVEMSRMGFRNSYGLEELVHIFSRYLDDDQSFHVDTMSDQGEKGFQEPQKYDDENRLSPGPEYLRYEVHKNLVKDQRVFCIMDTEYHSDGKGRRGWPLRAHWLEFQNLADALIAKEEAHELELAAKRKKTIKSKPKKSAG